MLWQIAALVVAAALIVTGVALVSPPAAFVVAGVLVAVVALFVDPDALRKGGKP